METKQRAERIKKWKSCGQKGSNKSQSQGGGKPHALGPRTQGLSLQPRCPSPPSTVSTLSTRRCLAATRGSLAAVASTLAFPASSRIRLRHAGCKHLPRVWAALRTFILATRVRVLVVIADARVPARHGRACCSPLLGEDAVGQPGAPQPHHGGDVFTHVHGEVFAVVERVRQRDDMRARRPPEVPCRRAGLEGRDSFATAHVGASTPEKWGAGRFPGMPLLGTWSTRQLAPHTSATPPAMALMHPCGTSSTKYSCIFRQSHWYCCSSASVIWARGADSFLARVPLSCT